MMSTTQDTVFEVGKFGKTWAKLETTYGEYSEPSSTDSLAVDELTIEVEQTRSNREDYPRVADFQQVVGKSKVGGSIGTYLMSGDTTGQVSDMDPVLTTLFGAAGVTTTATTVNQPGSPAPTATQFIVASAASLTDDISGVAIEINNVLELRRVTNISGTTITVSPPFSAAPANGATVYAVTSYHPANDPAWSMSLTSVNRLSAQYVTGCVATSGKWELDGGNLAKASYDYAGKRRIFQAADALAVGCDDDDVDLTVYNGRHFQAGAIIQIDDENMSVDSVSGDVLTVTRAYNSTSAAEHLADAAITPYTPTHSDAGDPISGSLGQIWVGNSRFELQKLNITHNNGLKLKEDEYGRDTPTGFAPVEPRTTEVDGTANFYVKDIPDGDLTSASLLVKSFEMDEVSLFVQAGSVVGDCVAFALPKMDLEIVNEPTASADKIQVDFKGKAKPSTRVGDDEIIMMTA